MHVFAFVFSVGRKKKKKDQLWLTEARILLQGQFVEFCVCLDANLCMWKTLKATLVAKPHTHKHNQSPKSTFFFCHTWQLKKMFCHKNCLPAMKLDLTLFFINIHAFCL